MKLVYLLAALLFLFSCNSNNSTESSQAIHEELPRDTTASSSPQIASLPPERDPNFQDVKDTVSQYGPYNISRSVLQDKNGVYWFATWEGIVSYDGKVFTNHTLKDRLNLFHVFSILEDRSGNLWFGMIGGGVYRYDGKNFALYTTNEYSGGKSVTCTLEDQNGTIWFGTDNGLSRYDGKVFSNFTTKEGLGSNFVSAIIQDKAGRIWIGTNGGINILNPSTTLWTGEKVFATFTNKQEGTSFHNVRTLLEDKTGKIWIGSQEGLSVFDGLNISSLSTNFIGNMFEDHAGNIWLSEADPKKARMTLVKFDGKSYTEIYSSTQVFGITQDKNENIWFGTEHGIRRFDGKSVESFLEK